MKKNSGSTVIVVGLIIFIVVTFLLAIGAMFGSKEFQQEIKKTTSEPVTYEEKNLAKMTPEAKRHYLKSQDLFAEIRKVRADPEAVKPLADKTIEEAKLGAEAQPDNAYLWSNLGNAYTWVNTVGEDDSALKAYKKALTLEPNNVVYSNEVGDQLIFLGKYDEAVLQLKKSVRMYDNSAYAHASLGTAYSQLKIWDEARAEYRRAIEIFEDENDDGRFDADILEAQKNLNSLPE